MKTKTGIAMDSADAFAREWDSLYRQNPGCDYPTVESLFDDYIDGRAGLTELWRALMPAWVSDARGSGCDGRDVAARRDAVAVFGAALLNRHQFSRESVWRTWVDLPLLEDGKHPEWVREVWRFLQREIGIPS